MNPEQALMFLKQTLVLKPGLTLEDCAAVVNAWNIIAQELENRRDKKIVKDEKSKQAQAD